MVAESARSEAIESLRLESRQWLETTSRDLTAQMSASESKVEASVVFEGKALRTVLKAAVATESAERLKREAEAKAAIEERVMGLQAKLEAMLMSESEATRAVAAAWVDQEAAERQTTHRALSNLVDQRQHEAQVQSVVVSVVQSLVDRVADDDGDRSKEWILNEQQNLGRHIESLRKEATAGMAEEKAARTTACEKLTAEVEGLDERLETAEEACSSLLKEATALEERVGELEQDVEDKLSTERERTESAIDAEQQQRRHAVKGVETDLRERIETDIGVRDVMRMLVDRVAGAADEEAIKWVSAKAEANNSAATEKVRERRAHSSRPISVPPATLPPHLTTSHLPPHNRR